MVKIDSIIWEFLVLFSHGKINDVEAKFEGMLHDVGAIVATLTEREKTWWDDGMTLGVPCFIMLM